MSNNKDYTPFDYLDNANIVETRDGEYYIAVIFGSHICFLNKEVSLGTDADYDENLKFKYNGKDLDIVALYKCEFDTDYPIFDVLNREDEWTLVWEEHWDDCGWEDDF